MRPALLLKALIQRLWLESVSVLLIPPPVMRCQAPIRCLELRVSSPGLMDYMASDMPRVGLVKGAWGTTEIARDFEARLGWGLKARVRGVATLLRHEAKLILLPAACSLLFF